MNNLNKNSNGDLKLSEIRNTYIALVEYLIVLMVNLGILKNSSYAEFSRKLGYKYNIIKDRKDSLKKHFPSKKSFDDIYYRLKDKYENQLAKYWNQITKRFNILYSIAFPLNFDLDLKLEANESSIKRKFFNDIKIVIKSKFPNLRIFDTDLSRILFTRARTLKDSHLKGSYKDRMLTLSMLFSFIYRIRKLTNRELINKIRDIQKVDIKTLKSLKHEIEAYIENFIFSNPYNIKYINDSYDIGVTYFKPEYELTLNVWMALSNLKEKPILLKVARRVLNYSSFGRINRFGIKDKGNGYSWDGLIHMTSRLKKLLPRESISKLLPKIKEYIKIRNLHPIEPRIYHRSWYTESIVKFHIIMLIIRDLGLEILKLDPIKPIAFKKTDIMERFTYERHHIFPNDKFSIDINRLVLTMHKNHAKLERNTNLILNLIQSRIQLTFDCPQYYKEHIADWNTKWQEYLERRIFLIEYGIENFVIHYFTDKNSHNYIIERFFNNTPKGEMESEIRNIIDKWITKNRPVPILNTYIFNKIFDGPPKLITSGYIKI